MEICTTLEIRCHSVQVWQGPQGLLPKGLKEQEWLLVPQIGGLERADRHNPFKQIEQHLKNMRLLIPGFLCLYIIRIPTVFPGPDSMRRQYKSKAPKPQDFRGKFSFFNMGGEHMALRHFQEANIIRQVPKSFPTLPYPSVRNVKTPTAFLQLVYMSGSVNLSYYVVCLNQRWLLCVFIFIQ